MKKGTFKKIFIFFLALTIVIWWSVRTVHPRAAPLSGLEVWMLDVGQGESVLLREPSGKKILFDGGPDDSVLSELGAVLPPWDKTIDLVILSHNHSDHIRGIISVLERFIVKEIWVSGAIHTTDDYKEFLRKARAKNIKPTVKWNDYASCLEICPPPVDFGEIHLQLYHPLKDMVGMRPKDQHEAALVVKATYQERSILLTGDIDETQERAMMSVCKPEHCSLDSTLFQQPHHGSASGMSMEFLRAVNPQASLIPVGADNKFGHPAPSILSKLQQAQIPVFRTDKNGRIHAILHRHGYTVSTEKDP